MTYVKLPHPIRVLHVLLIALLLDPTHSRNHTIALLHLRKSGGTFLSSVIQAWLKYENCTKSRELSFLYVKSGAILPQKANPNSTHQQPTLCAGINILKLEFHSIYGEKLITLPNRSLRLNSDSKLSFLTSLRHPIDRLVSQAFYGTGNIGIEVFDKWITRKYPHVVNLGHSLALLKSCQQLNSRSHRGVYFLGKAVTRLTISTVIKEVHHIDCDCGDIEMLWNKSLEIIRQNETVWFEWMNKRPGYGDMYTNNYYIRRLSAHFPILSNKQSTKYNKSTDCLISPLHCPFSMFELISNLFHGTRNHKNFEYNITDRDVMISKRLLIDQFDFIINEQTNNVVRIKNSLRGVFPASFLSNIRGLPVENAGLLSIFNVSYREVLPFAVLKRMEAENAADIEFYSYAVQVFNERAAAENWDLDI